jgi:Family of unknown function (DUF6188)
MEAQAQELPDRWILQLRGSRVTGVAWNDRVRFRLDPLGEIAVGDGALITDGPLTAPGAQARTLGELGEGEVARAVGARVLSAVGFKNGALRVVLDNGWHLNVRRADALVSASVIVGESVAWSRDNASAPPSAAG